MRWMVGCVALMAAGCASGAPPPAPVEEARATPPAGPEIRIGQCSRASGPPAPITYPEGWDERLAESFILIPTGDELLGGPGEVVRDRNVAPLTLPRPERPGDPALARVEAVCDILLDTTPAGEPIDLWAACSRPGFEAAAEASMAKARFAPRMVDGAPIGRKGVLYTMLFCLGRAG